MTGKRMTRVGHGASRRHLLAGALAGLGGRALLGPAAGAGAGAAATPRGVRYDGEMETLVRLLEQTPRDKLVEVVGQKIRAGVRYNDLLGATLLAGVRSIRARPVGFEFHCVLAVYSAHQAAMATPEGERFLPLLWAMDNFKGSQETKRRKGEAGWVLPAVDSSKLPSSAQARQSFVQAMEGWDEEAADRAVTALYRGATSPAAKAELRDLVFRYGARDFRDIGHKAIFAASAWRTLQIIGWQHGEAVLRSLAFACLEHEGENPQKRDADADRPWRDNLARVRTVRADWLQGNARPEATRELLQGLRKASPADASAAVAKQLAARTDPASIWDALFLFASELVLRHAEIVSLHSVTTMNALYQAYRMSGQPGGNPETQLLMLLQAPAFLAMFRDNLDDDYRTGARVDPLARNVTPPDPGGHRAAHRHQGPRRPRLQVQLRRPGRRPVHLPPLRPHYLSANRPLLPSTDDADNTLIAQARPTLTRT